MSTLQTLVNRACDDASAASSDLSNQLEALKNNVTSSRNAIENLLKQAQNGVSIGSQTVKTDLSQFKQDLKNTNLPGADDGDNAADSDTVIDYSEATPPSDTDPVDPNYTLSPSEEPAQSADLSTPDESSTAAQDTAPAQEPAQEPAAEGGEADRTPHGQPGPEAVDDSADSTVVSEDDGTATKPDERYPIDPNYTLITEGLDDLPDTKDVLNDISDALPDSVDVEIPKVELTNRDAITASRNDLSSSLTSMGDIVSSLNNNASSNSQALINDVKAISKQINKIGQTLSGASENVNRDADDIVDDVSDDDTDDDVEAKVTNCINSGTVNADLNAGGITGAMARENDLDPEDDYTTAGSESLNFTFRPASSPVTAQTTARSAPKSRTRAASSATRDGLCHRLQGLWHPRCRGRHRRRRRGRYQQVHDPRELRQGPPVRCKAGRRHCRSGATIENCRAMVMIDNAAERIGAIAGIVDDPLDGSVTGNTFVDGGVAGIDSVSYQGIAEPLAYEDFVAQENLPGDFGSICVRFVTDEDSLVQEYHIPYGSDFPTDQLPPVPNHQASTAAGRMWI